MKLLRDIREKVGHAAAPMIGVAVVVYFAYHAVQGDRGLLTWIQLRQEIIKAQAEQQSVAAEKIDLEHHVSLLRSDGIDPDLLEERAREMLGLGYPGEKIILLPPEARK